MHDVRRLARELDTALARPIDADADARVRRALRGDPPPSRRGPFVAAAIAAAFVLGLILARPSDAPVPPAADPPAPIVVLAPPVPSACSIAIDGDRTRLAGFCRHRVDRMFVETWDEAVLAPHEHGVRIVSGWATFAVDPVREGPPVEVAIADGVLRVLGTRFVVFEGSGEGHVDLVEGSIEHVHADGTITRVQPGERVGWGDAITPTPTRRPSAPAQRRAAEPVAPLDVPLDRIASLRAAGRYDEALAILRGLDPARLDARVAEVVDFEAGTIVQDHLGRTDAACRHWTDHLRRWPAGRYRAEAARRRAAACSSPAAP